MKPAFSPQADPPGVTLWDPIENARFEVHTGGTVALAPGDPEAFRFPVDSVATVAVRELSFPSAISLVFREDGRPVVEAGPDSQPAVPAGTYEVEVGGLPLKLYFRFEGAASVGRGDDRTTVDFDGETEVALGTRSLHERPAGTVTTTGEPADLARAVSTFGSALKTRSPERSWPTLRGHPPLIELGDELDVPPEVEPPETDVTIEVPDRRDAVYQVTPLSFYLGAEVEIGDEPALRVNGTVEPLGDPPDIHGRVGEVLGHVFLLDCVARTEGLYSIPLAERRELDDRLALDWGALYDASPADRLARYLEVPREEVADLVPGWHLTTDVTPSPDHAVTLPYLADDLSLVRCPSGTPGSPAPPEPPGELTDFFRGGSGPVRGAGADDDASGDDDAGSDKDPDNPAEGGASTATAEGERRPGELVEGEVFVPDPVETPGHAWVGEGYPLGGSKPTPETYRRRVDAGPREDHDIEVAVVVNDERMVEEPAADLYGRDMVEFAVEVHWDRSTEELRDLLASDLDFFHYVGHVDDEGLRCHDGWLDLRDLEETGVSAFLLNACRSTDQGHALVEAGSRGGVTTVTDVHNAVATEAGKTLARLLNAGFSLHAALYLTREELVTSYRYTIVGDGELQLCQNKFGVPALGEVEETPEGYRFTDRSFPAGSRASRLGTVVYSAIDAVDEAFLAGGEVGTWSLTAEQLRDLLAIEGYPVRVGNELRWSEDLEVDVGDAD